MSETNLRTAIYALDLRNLRLSNSIREELNLSNLSVNARGLVDITEFSKLTTFSSILQDGKSEERQRDYSPAHLNLYVLNDRIRVHMLEIFSNILEVDLFELLGDGWNEFDRESRELVNKLFNSIFFDNNEDPTIDELIRFWFSYNNPAHTIYSKELYGLDNALDQISSTLTQVLTEILGDLPQIEEGDIFEFLTEPEATHPTSIRKQIDFILENWAKYLNQENLKFLLMALDLLKEEEKFRGFGGHGDTEVYEFDGSGHASYYGGDLDYEQFSSDQHWMPRLVLIAKNIYVWLDQMSKKYGRTISTLSEIPDQELDLLSSRGFTGLWLVGIWERSPASKRIKEIIGNSDDIASAYSIYDYEIAQSLGGDEEFEELKRRLRKRGIRLGADMVPNHMGIQSKWTEEHPEWFIQTHDKPYPQYSYHGEDISTNPDIEIYLEDHYYDQSDAAVTFKHVDSNSGEVRYIYHGNDGTSFPWNDTAQIDFLNAEAREKVISEITDVAKKFPIIRFDAAMVLAKQHIRRLWYPAPGEGGDIPSRSQYAMSNEEFNDAIPNEFWREVVDRINSEAPDTLLLAEAFWLLEGYFVRTLGMHRVYNSAFMKMLANEDNSKYRQTIKNVLEYDPEILKRFVNYLTTPDEDPAIQTFGTGDKYFGIATMMATMPGLPMFGHGQFEGLTEKYGMEFSKAKYEEEVNQDLIHRHELEIVPLLKKRYLFAGSENFYLYDFFTSDGMVNEDVFAYSNRFDGEKALIIYNNRYAEATGWIKRSVAFSEKLGDKTTRLRQVDLFEGLDLSNTDGYLLFKDHADGLEYIRSKDEIREKGLFVQVGAFKYHVFVDLKEVSDEQEIWKEIEDELNGRGTENIQAMYEQRNNQEPVIVDNLDYDKKSEAIRASVPDNSSSKLKVEIEGLKEENEALKGQISAMTAEVEELQELTAELENVKTQRDNLQHEVQSQASQSAKSRGDYQELQAKITQLTATNESLNQENTTLQKENSSLKSELKKSGDNTDIIQNLKAQVNRLESELKKSRDKVKHTETRLHDKEQEISRLEDQLDEIKSENRDLKEDIGTKKQYGRKQDTLLSSVLLETISNRLMANKSGIRLRNLAMSLGISASVCLEHVKTMQARKQVEIKYNSDDDQNPLIIAK